MSTRRHTIGILAGCQGLLFINNSTVIAINALAGRDLAEGAGLGAAYATVPVTAWVIGGALTAMPAAHVMRRLGRRVGFTLGALIGVLGALVASGAMYLQSFWGLALGTLIFGGYNGFAQQYRFAAADASPPDFKAQAISYVLAGGLVGGLVGPELSTLTIDLFATRYLGAYLTLTIFLVLAILLIQQLRIPNEAELKSDVVPRPMWIVARQPAFLVAVIGAAFGYAVMNLLMVATPLAMTHVAHHPYGSAASVISSHVIAMFAPSFFTGSLIKRFGVLTVMLVGVALQVATVIVALSGITVSHFWWAMVLLGLGWNFLYIGGTTLLTQTYHPVERAKAQGTNEFCIFLVMVATSFSSGFLLDTQGWALLNYLSAGLLGVTALAILWLGLRQRAAAVAAA
jgi:MFS family permease